MEEGISTIRITGGRKYSAVACTRKMKNMAETCVAAVARGKTGRTRTASDLDAALDQWIELLNVRKTEEHDKTATSMQTQEALQRAEVIRGPMIHRQGRKSTCQSTATTDTEGFDSPADAYSDAPTPLKKRRRTSAVAEEIRLFKKIEKNAERFVDIFEKSVTSQRQSQGPSKSMSTIQEPQITGSRRLDDFSAGLHRIEAKMDNLHRLVDKMDKRFEDLMAVLLSRAAGRIPRRIGTSENQEASPRRPIDIPSSFDADPQRF